MATHPFAIKLEDALVNARRALEALRAAKKQSEEQEADTERPPKKTHPYRFIQLGAIAYGQMENQGLATPGEALYSADKKALALKADKQLAALNAKYAEELGKCSQARREAEANGSQLARDSFGSRTIAAQGKKVSMPCPGAVSAAEQISAYLTRTYGDI